jgi:hypothetical protein
VGRVGPGTGHAGHRPWTVGDRGSVGSVAGVVVVWWWGRKSGVDGWSVVWCGVVCVCTCACACVRVRVCVAACGGRAAGLRGCRDRLHSPCSAVGGHLFPPPPPAAVLPWFCFSAPELGMSRQRNSV